MSSFSSQTVLEDSEKSPCEKKADTQAPLPPCDAEAPPSTKVAAADTPGDKYLVILDPDEDPKNWSAYRRWLILLVITSAAHCATWASSAAAFTEAGLVTDLHTVQEVTILSISLYVEGLALGPLLIGPLSEVYGRNNIYRVSYILFFAFTWPTTFPPDMATFLVFRFITGFCSSAFLSVAGGSVGDLFAGSAVASAMAVYTLGPFLGPVVGPLISGFICQNVDWRWTYRVLLIWQFATILMLYLFVPETYEPVILKRKAARLRKETGDNQYWAPLDRREGTLTQAILLSCYTPFRGDFPILPNLTSLIVLIELLLFDRMALLLDTWSALVLGILYLAFQAFPVIFQGGHGFNVQDTGMSFLGIGIGMLMAAATQPLWNRLNEHQAAKYSGKPPPEARLVMGQLGGVLVPIGLFWLAFTTYRQVPWIVPIIASVPFGAGAFYVFTSTFTYLVMAYRPIAASAMASNTAWRCTFAAVFPLFAGQMYNRLGTVGATALLAGLTTLMMPLPFVIYKMGARLREKSQFAVSS
ncbi:uncharacterized protein FIBRA_02086 [Fibroporia radiculosa]|uniref:Major facilitator superfamily (MFS) profile domain-containing protein n=1 Tax=Fibroporia radiculosa TaxID=599839 RepID=J4H1N0_9APHY|nr:uncharacterized protein FIBRA_02086 [Fibroporia radiculosa]CCM00059.1 predicted protein [Fibroporia radiculosa]